MLSKNDLKFAIEDARVRQTALLNLLYEMDKKALSLLRICVTLALASYSIIAAAIARANLLEVEFFVGFVVIAMGFTLAAYFCVRVFLPAEVGLPGRAPDFWMWYASRENTTFKEAALEYLKELEGFLEKNRNVNHGNAKELRRAKYIFVFTPLLGAISAIVTAAIIYWSTTLAL